MRLHVEALVGLVGALGAVTGSAQSIADYSHAQRALIEAGMAQAAARVAALSASSAASQASAAAAPRAQTTPTMRAPESEIVVAGVFDSQARTVAEIHVDGHPYLLSPGQPVSGTDWHVARIAIDRVVLARATGHAGSARPAAVTRTFELPTWR